MDMLDNFELQQLEALREQKENCGGVSTRPLLTVCFRQLHFSLVDPYRLVNLWSARCFNIIY